MSYYFFTEGQYPASLPSHPNPPPPKPPVANIHYHPYSVTADQLHMNNREIVLFNTQLAPVLVDFSGIAQATWEINPHAML